MTNSRSIVPFELAGDISNRSQNIRRMTAAAREFHATTVRHETFERGLDALRATHAMSGLEGVGMIIEGEPGVGKTTLLNKHVIDTYSKPEYRPTDIVTPLPILMVRIPGRPTIPRVIEKFLLVSDHVKVSARKTETLETRLHKLIIHQGVEMIVLDEYQHLLRTEKYTRDTLNFLKVLIDDYKLSIVLSGLPSGLSVLQDHDELRERVSFEHVILKPFDITTNANAADYARYIIGLETKLNKVGVDCCSLSNEDMLQRLLLATQGKARHISRLLMRLLIHCGESNKITMRDFEDIYPTMPLGVHLGSFNPFSSGTSIDKVQRRQKEYDEARNNISRKNKK